MYRDYYTWICKHVHTSCDKICNDDDDDNHDDIDEYTMVFYSVVFTVCFCGNLSRRHHHHIEPSTPYH